MMVVVQLCNCVGTPLAGGPHRGPRDSEAGLRRLGWVLGRQRGVRAGPGGSESSLRSH